METLDPLKYFLNTPHIIDLILSHLSVREILTVCSINSNYYNTVSKSTVLQKRAKLKISKESLVHSEAIKSSEIDYRSLELDLSFTFNAKINEIVKCFSIQYLQLKNCQMSAQEFLEFFSNFPHLEVVEINELKMNSTEIGTLSDMAIKEMQLKSIPETLVHPLLKKCKHLKKLSIMQLSRKAPVDEMLHQIANDTSLQLEYFELCDFGYYNFDQAKLGLHSFLQKSFYTLKVLDFDVWIGVSSLKLIFGMPQLEKLRLYELSHADKDTNWKSIQLPVNTKIMHLNLQDYSHNIDLLSILLRASPRLKILEVYALNHEDIKEIATYSPYLTELSAYFLDINETHSTIFKEKDIFKNLKTCNVSVSDDLKKQFLARSESERSHLENLLLAN